MNRRDSIYGGIGLSLLILPVQIASRGEYLETFRFEREDDNRRGGDLNKSFFVYSEKYTPRKASLNFSYYGYSYCGGLSPLVIAK